MMDKALSIIHVNEIDDAPGMTSWKPLPEPVQRLYLIFRRAHIEGSYLDGYVGQLQNAESSVAQISNRLRSSQCNPNLPVSETLLPSKVTLFCPELRLFREDEEIADAR